MPGQSDFGASELHETIRGGERVLIRPARMRVSGAMTIRSQIDGDLRALIRRMSIH